VIVYRRQRSGIALVLAFLALTLQALTPGESAWMRAAAINPLWASAPICGLHRQGGDQSPGHSDQEHHRECPICAAAALSAVLNAAPGAPTPVGFQSVSIALAAPSHAAVAAPPPPNARGPPPLSA
jgi:hypothetical protein